MGTLIAFFLSAFEGPAGAVLMIIGFLMAFGTGCWLLLKAFLVDWKVGLASLVIPLAYIILGFKHERLRRTAFYHVASIAYAIGIFSLRALARSFFEAPV